MQANKMSSRNQRKLQVLTVMASNGYAYTSSLLASKLNLEVHNARTLLKRYSNMGLLNRRKSKQGAYVYWISEKGYRRLEWLKGHVSPPRRGSH